MSTNRVRYAYATYGVRHHAWVRFERRGNGNIWEARGMIITNGTEFRYHSETPHYLTQVFPYNSTALPRMTPGILRRLTMAVDEVEAFLRQQRNHYGYSSGCPECERLRRAHLLYRPRVPLTRARLAEHNNGFRMIYVPHPRAYEPASPPASPEPTATPELSASPEPTATPGPSASPTPPYSAQDDDEDDDEDDDSADSVTIAATSNTRCCSMCSDSSIERRRATQREQRIQQQERRRDREQRRLEREGRLRDLGGLPVRRLQ